MLCYLQQARPLVRINFEDLVDEILGLLADEVIKIGTLLQIDISDVPVYLILVIVLAVLLLGLCLWVEG